MNNSFVGTTAGAVAGVYKAVSAVFLTFTYLTWEIVLQTGTLAVVGGACGWLGAEIVKQIKRAFIAWRLRKNEQEAE